MGLWRRLVDSWRKAKARDEEVDKQAAIDRMLKDQDRLHCESGRDPRLPPRGDRG